MFLEITINIETIGIGIAILCLFLVLLIVLCKPLRSRLSKRIGKKGNSRYGLKANPDGTPAGIVPKIEGGMTPRDLARKMVDEDMRLNYYQGKKTGFKLSSANQQVFKADLKNGNLGIVKKPTTSSVAQGTVIDPRKFFSSERLRLEESIEIQNTHSQNSLGPDKIKISEMSVPSMSSLSDSKQTKQDFEVNIDYREEKDFKDIQSPKLKGKKK